MSCLYELHSHLYGSLNIEDLHWLAARRPPRWEIFTQSYRDLYGQEAKIENLFSKKEADQKRLASYYYFKNKSGFVAFQNCFNLIIALAHTDPEELKEICLRVGRREKADYAEYRMMFSPLLSNTEFVNKSLALCEALATAEEACLGKKTFRLVLSLSREDAQAQRQYKLIKTNLQANELVCKFLVGIDFCNQEEGYPPEKKRAFCQKVLQDNRKDHSKSLAILYHVGESYGDKSVESAVRWIVQAARMGAHRLGHAVALGIPPELYLGKKRKEDIEECLAQLAFEVENADSLNAAGYKVNIDRIETEKQKLKIEKEKKTEHWIIHEYNEKRIKALWFFQNWAMEELKKTSVIIESCPTSNLKICALASPANHPLLRFLKNNLKLVIASDDPGILDTNIEAEYQRIQKWPGITEKMIDTLKENAVRWTAKKIAASQSVSYNH